MVWQTRRSRDAVANLSLLVAMATVTFCLVGRRAGAADEMLSGDTLVLTAPGIRIVSHDPAIALGGGRGSADDPAVHGGSLRVLSVEGDVFDTTYPLPAARWHYRQRGRHRSASSATGAITGYVFRGPAPIRSVTVKAGRVIRILGSGPGLGHTLGANPAPVRVVLTLGAQQYCMSFSGTDEFKKGVRYRSTASGAPELCPLPYGNDDTWLCRPGITSNQCFVNSLDSTVIHPDLSTTFEPETGTEDHPYDCFYVYPTVDLSNTPGNHLDVTDPSYVALTLDPLLSQAARFNGLCRIFAPHYRQVTFSALGSPDAPHFVDIAFGDVLDAWRLYLKYYNGGRNVVIMGHSQGTIMLNRLMRQEVDPSPALRGRLIVALLIGGDVSVPQGTVIGGSFANIPLCTSPGQTGCVIAYHTFAAAHPPMGGANIIGGDPTLDVACTNPAALGSSAAGAFTATYFPTHSNQPLFAVVADSGFTTPFIEYPDFYAGRCVKDANGHSYLEVSASPGPSDQRQDLVLYDSAALSPSLLGTHILDYNWTMGDLLSLVATKAAMMP
jgi:hypothetical protein